MQNDRGFKKCQLQKKVHNSIISQKNREFCPIFTELIAYMWYVGYDTCPGGVFKKKIKSKDHDFHYHSLIMRLTITIYIHNTQHIVNEYKEY